ncbi:ArsR/SmtB family transcription factor [Kitasatospora sp. NPDC094028]
MTNRNEARRAQGRADDGAQRGAQGEGEGVAAGGHRHGPGQVLGGAERGGREQGGADGGEDAGGGEHRQVRGERGQRVGGGEDVTLAAAMHALSDPLRLRIVDLLARRGESECSAIHNALGIGKSNASQHFRVLRECGLILRTHHGQQQSARLRAEEFEARFPGLLRAVLDNVDSAV